MSWWDNFDSVGTMGAGLLNPPQIQIPGVIQNVLNDVSGALGDIFGGGGAVDVSGQPPAAGPPQTTPQGTDLNSMLQQLLGGAAGAGTAGGSGAAAAPAGYTTPDGVFINDNSPEDRYYRLVDAVWTKIYGAHPPFSITRTFHDMGIENTDQLNQVMLQMPSHIKLADGAPINIGTYESMLTVGNQFANKYFGRPVPDSLIQQWAQGGLTEPAAIENWFWSHPAKDLPKDTYGAVWDAANQWTQKVWGDFPHPDQVSAIANQASPVNPVGTSPTGY